MIENFEEITAELTAEEKKLIPLLIKGFMKHGINDPIKAPKVIAGINKHNGNKKFSGARLRKLTNFIRCHSILPLIATSKGYYVSYEQNIIEGQIRSLRDRADAIHASANGLLKFITKK